MEDVRIKLTFNNEYFAVKKAVEKTKLATSESGDRKIGVFGILKAPVRVSPWYFIQQDL